MPISVVLGGEACFAAFFLALLAVAAVVDIRRRVIPDALVLGIAVLWLTRCAFRCLVEGAGLMSAVIAPALCAITVGAALLCLTLFVEHVTKAPAFGGGDIKLIASATLFFGPVHVLSLLLCICIAGAILAMAYRLRGCKVFPFGPAIAGGALALMVILGL